MIRTQVYLTEKQARALELKSLQEKRSKAEILRRIVDRGLAADTAAPRKTAGEALLELAELGKRLGLSGTTDLSTKHDDYLYGDKK